MRSRNRLPEFLFASLYSAAAFFILVLLSCSNEPAIKITSSTALSNYQPGKTDKEMLMDYSNAIDSGFIIPSTNQVQDGSFKFTFTIKNNKHYNVKFYYKLFYQNVTYMFRECLDKNYTEYNFAASENFYGSWESMHDSIKEITIQADESLTVTDFLRITGNPRDEQKYYGTDDARPVDSEMVERQMNHIASDKNWFASIKAKAKNERRSVEDQLRLDAIYVLKQDPGELINQRWKRNPRTGTYKFYLLLIPANNLRDVPEHVKHINKTTDNTFINPLFFVHQKIKFGTSIKAVEFKESVTLKAMPDVGDGIYIDEKTVESRALNTEFYNAGCNSSSGLYKTAAFEQYFHHLPVNFYSPNVPEVMDLQNEFTVYHYKSFVEKYDSSSLSPSTNISSICPCENVKVDTAGNKLILITPGVRRNLMKKENTGINSRHGFTYGKYTFKVKMPELINKYNAWNGLTNALWLINQNNADWNARRNCGGDGYIPKEVAGEEGSPRKPSVSYTEIDFEIRKGHPHWPKTSYSPHFPKPNYDFSDSGNVVVLCTNWDLACNAPSAFNAGAVPFRRDSATYTLHRWTHFYQALSSKYAAADDELFAGPYYYFQIDWKPESITWRIGPEKTKLREVCYMDASVTSIPNNQMVMVFTQEYHISEWWPESQFLQEYVPIPSKDIIGEIHSVEIE